MTIRLRYYVAVLPLFAGFALANGLLLYVLERREITWGINQQAKGAALTVAAFVGEGAPTDGPPPPEPTAFRKYGDLLGGIAATWFEPAAGGWRALPLANSADFLAPPPPDARVATTVAANEPVVRLVTRPDADHDDAIGYAGVFTADGRLRAIVATTTRDTVLRTQVGVVWHQVQQFGISLVVLGVIVAEFLTQLARRETRRLTAAASDIVRGNFAPKLGDGRIRELNDLAGTLQTMASSLDDEAQRTKRRFLQAKLLPREHELGEGYERLCERMPTPAQDAPLEVRRVGQRHPGDFLGSRTTAGHTVAVVGRLESVPEGLEAAVRTSAIREFYLGIGVALAIGRAAPDIRPPWPCVQVDLLMAVDGGPVQVYAATGSDPLAAWPSASSLVGTISAAARRFAVDYLRRSASASPRVLADEVERLLARESGVVAVWRSDAGQYQG